MSHLNVEIKARCHTPQQIREYLRLNNAVFKGIDYQTDTYFNVSKGRLKLREGNIENNLIYYERENDLGPKSSNFTLVELQDFPALKNVLNTSLGVKAVVEKVRAIWFIDNVKFHIDDVKHLGSFVEIEASNLFKDLSKEYLQTQCDYYITALDLVKEDFIELSYSDMLMK